MTVTTRRAFGCLSLLVTIGLSMGWAPQPPPPISRQALLEGLAVSVAGTLLFPGTAHADITSKVGSSSALRNVKRAQNQLDKLLPFAEAKDFMAVKEFLRTSPFTEVRKNCFILIRGGEDGPKADALLGTYKSFISSVEQIDGTASLGIRGSKISQLQMSEEYSVVVSTMRDFLEVAEEAVEIPMQYKYENY
jgi:hypothetical protein